MKAEIWLTVLFFGVVGFMAYTTAYVSAMGF